MFDFVIVVLCVIPQLEGQAALLRLLRLLRVLKLLKMIEQLQIILRGLARGLTSIGYITMLLFLCFYLFGIIGIMLFKESDPAHFSGLGHALLTLFRAATMEDWSDLMYISMLGCGEYGYPALDETGWVPDLPPRNNTITAFCDYAPLGRRTDNATEICGAGGIVAPGQTANALTANSRACFTDWSSYLRAAHERSWIMWLGSTGSTAISPVYYIFFLLVAGIVMLSLFIGAVTLGMQQAMDETTESKKKAIHERLKSAARTSQSQIMQNDSTANKVARMWMGEIIEEEEEEEVKETKVTYAEAPLQYVFEHYLFEPAYSVAYHSLFTKFITAVIVAAAILVGFDFTQTQPIDLASWIDCGGECLGVVTGVLEMAINIIFTFEVVAKLLGEAWKPWRYFYSGWNVFDFLIVALAWAPGSGDFVVVLRLLRLLRVLKLVRALPQLQVIVSALIAGFGSIGYIALLLFLIYYLYAIIGMLLFQANDPWHFGSLHITMFTLFRCSTLEDWTDVMYINMYGCDVYGYRGNYMLERECRSPQVPFGSAATSVMFFLTFVVLTNLVTLSLFIGVVTTAMQEATDSQNDERRKQKQIDSLEEKYVNVLMAGLRWSRLPTKPLIGSELKHTKLSAALARGQTKFERHEFDLLDVQGLGWDCHIEGATGQWFKPAPLEPDQLKKLQAKAKLRIEEFQKIFSIFDWSGDRIIDRQEFSFAIKCLNPSATENQISDWMMLGDENCTGEIDFLAFCQVLMTLDQNQRAASASKALDIDNRLLRWHRKTRAQELMKAGTTCAKEVMEALVREVNLEPSYSLIRMSSLEALANRRRAEGRPAALFPEDEARRPRSPSPGVRSPSPGVSSPIPIEDKRPPAICGAAATISSMSEKSSTSTGSSGAGKQESGADAQVAGKSASSPSDLMTKVGMKKLPFGVGNNALDVLRRAGRKTMATRRFRKAPLAALALGEATIPPEFGDLMAQCQNAQLRGKNLELILLKLGHLKAACSTRLQRSKTSDGDEPSETTLFCEALSGQIDDLESVLYIQLKPKLIGIDDDGNGQLILGGHVVAQTVHQKRGEEEEYPTENRTQAQTVAVKLSLHARVQRAFAGVVSQIVGRPVLGFTPTAPASVVADPELGEKEADSDLTAVEVDQSRAAEKAAIKIQDGYRAHTGRRSMGSREGKADAAVRTSDASGRQVSKIPPDNLLEA